MFATILLSVLLGLFGAGCASRPPAADSQPENNATREAPVAVRTALSSTTVTPTTYYVRPDGGSTVECTGLVDAPYPGAGTEQPCAWDHPFRALQPSGEPSEPGIAQIAGGDTLVIGAGEYRMGLGAPGAESCQSDYPWDCYMAAIPSGPNPDQPTRILGEGWDTGCNNPPELWGAESAWSVINLRDSSNVEVACLEITDHSECVEFHTGGLACARDAYPYGDWSPTGIYAEDSAHVILRDLDIHGLAHHGIWAGRLADWTLEDVRLVGNGWVGWDGDIEGGDVNTGTLTFRHWTVAWNGCGETYPGGEPIGCWGQSAGGYGDGVGTDATAGDWVIEDSAFLHNSSDGLDLLYHRLGGTVTIRRSIAEGNAGDQIKVTGRSHLENVIAISNCGFFNGKPFTHDVDHCRAGGSALAFTLHPGDLITVVNSTITGEGDCLVIAECVGDETCNGDEFIVLRNDIFRGNQEFRGTGDTTCFTWTDMAGELFTTDHAIISDVKATPDPCPPGSFCGVSPGLVSGSVDSFDARLIDASPAIDAGATTGAPVNDFAGAIRDDQTDIGAYEWSEGVSIVYLPGVAGDSAVPYYARAEIVETYDHDETAFTQGLVFDGNTLYESTGLYGESSLRRVDLASGDVLQIKPLPEHLFGEGCTVWQDRIVQVTWKAGTGFVYDKQSFEVLREFTYGGEGWGLTHDGERLIMSDGTSTLRFLDPETLAEVNRVDVLDGHEPVERLNELEWLGGQVWANVWQTSDVVRINPTTGQVVGWIDFSGLTEQEPRGVLNGIAVKDGELFVTGKLWSSLYKVRLRPIHGAQTRQ